MEMLMGRNDRMQRREDFRVYEYDFNRRGLRQRILVAGSALLVMGALLAVAGAKLILTSGSSMAAETVAAAGMLLVTVGAPMALAGGLVQVLPSHPQIAAWADKLPAALAVVLAVACAASTQFPAVALGLGVFGGAATMAAVRSVVRAGQA